MSGPVPSPSMKGMIGRSGTSRRFSASCQAISWPSAGGVKSLNVLAKTVLLLKGDGKMMGHAAGRARARRGTYHRERPGTVLQSGLMDWEPLVAAATAARAHAYAPYSRFAVGAALLMEDGSIHAAANVENVHPGALDLRRAQRHVRRGLGRPPPPPGGRRGHRRQPPRAPAASAARPSSEFARDLPILVVNVDGDREETSLAELFPQPFSLPG